MATETPDQALKNALARGELVYHYQPRVDLLSGQVSGFEALIRWVKPDGSIVMPGSFLPAAESSGFIHEISLVMFDKLVADIAIIQRFNSNLVASFNLTAQDFLTEEFISKLKFAVASGQVNPDQIQLEITETTLINGSANVKKNVQSVVDMGISLAMDDFGTGYSTIDVLSQWPFSVVKIDQGLIGRMQSDGKSITIARNAINMAHQLGLKIVAEGVETEDVYDFLLKSGCSEVQGYLLGRPMSLDQFLEFLQTDRRWRGSPIGLIHMAQADHLQWRRQLIDYTIGKLYGVPDLSASGKSQVELDPHQCLLGRWYYGVGRSYSGMAAYDQLEGVHNRLHNLGELIIEAIHEGLPRVQIIGLLRQLTETSGEIISLLQKLELDALLERGEGFL